MPQFYYRYGVAEEKNPKFRRTMEDTHVHVKDVEGIKGQAFFAIFDGHGGKKASSYCKHMAYKFFMYIKSKNPEMPIPDVFHRTFAMIDEGLKAKSISSGATAVIAFLQIKDDKTTLYTANVGDSRVVLCRGGKAIRLSYDHKASDPNEQQRITEAGGIIFGDRVLGSLAITRALGDIAVKHLVVSHPYTTTTNITENDACLILACDGVWDVFSDQEAVDQIKEVNSAQESSDLLMKQSLERGSTDNVSVMVIKFQAEFVENPVEKEKENPPKKEGGGEQGVRERREGEASGEQGSWEDDQERSSQSELSDPEFGDATWGDL